MAFKRYRKRGRSRSTYRRQRKLIRTVGNRPGSSTCKTKAATYASENLATIQFKVHELIQIEKDTTGDDVSKRERDIVNFRGVKFWLDMWSLWPGNDMVVNVAVLMSNDETTPASADLLRGYGNKRSEPMGQWRTYLENTHSAINTDNYKVLMRKKIKLQPSPDTTNNELWENSERLLKVYIKVNRQLRFEGTAINPMEGRMFLCLWADECTRSVGSAGTTGRLTHNLHIFNYFREPRN